VEQEQFEKKEWQKKLKMCRMKQKIQKVKSEK